MGIIVAHDRNQSHRRTLVRVRHWRPTHVAEPSSPPPTHVCDEEIGVDITIHWEMYRTAAQNEHARRFLIRLARKGRQPKTIDAYGRNLDHFLASYRGADPRQWIEADEDEILLYIAAMKKQSPKRRPRQHVDNTTYITGNKISNATVNQRIVTIRGFYDDLIRRHVRKDPANPLPRGNDGKKGQRPQKGVDSRMTYLPWVPPDDDWKRIVLHVITRESPRNIAMILLAYDAALRREELMSLRPCDIDFDRSLVTIRPETSKSGREHVVPLSPFVCHAVKHYMTMTRQTLVTTCGADAHGGLFLSESTQNAGQPLRVGAFNDVIEKVRATINLPLLKPHTLRHQRLTTLKRAGVPLDDIATFAGHADVETTRIYLHIAPVELASVVREASRAFDSFIENLIEEHIP